MLIRAYSPTVKEFLKDQGAKFVKHEAEYTTYDLETLHKPALFGQLLSAFPGEFKIDTSASKKPGYHLNDGTPPVGYQPRVKTSVTLDPGILEQLDSFREPLNLSRSQLIEEFLTAIL